MSFSTIDQMSIDSIHIIHSILVWYAVPDPIDRYTFEINTHNRFERRNLEPNQLCSKIMELCKRTKKNELIIQVKFGASLSIIHVFIIENYL